MSEKKTQMVDDLEGAYKWLTDQPLIKWCAEKRVQLENEKHNEPPKGILTKEQAEATKTNDTDAELAAALKTMA